MAEARTALCDLTRNLVQVPENRNTRELIATSASCCAPIAVGAAGAVVASTGAAPSSPSLERRSYWIDHQNHWTGNMHEKVRQVMYYVLLLLLYTVK